MLRACLLTLLVITACGGKPPPAADRPAARSFPLAVHVERVPSPPDGPSVEGVVRNVHHDHEGIIGVSFVLTAGGTTVAYHVTDDHGRFTTAHLPDGRYDASLYYAGAEAHTTVEVRAGSRVRLRLDWEVSTLGTGE